MIPPDVLSFDLDGDGHPDVRVTDINGDGVISGKEVLAALKAAGIKPGSAKAKIFWSAYEEATHSQEAKDYAVSQGHPDATGWHEGGPLQPGQHPGDKDFNYLVLKLMVSDGLSGEQAQNVAGNIRAKLYG